MGCRVTIIDIDDHANSIDPGPIPDPELGKNISSIDDARRWLSHPTNWFESHLFIVKWDGLVPKVNKDKGRMILNGDRECDSLLACVVVGQRKRKLSLIAESTSTEAHEDDKDQQ